MDEGAYDRSADFRLLELSRQSLGVNASVSAWSHASRTIAEEQPEEDELAPPVGALLKVHFVARPATGLIVGARVTVAVAIENEGATRAESVSARIGYGAGCVPLPADAKLDENELEESAIESLFGQALALGTISPGGRRTIVASIAITAGLLPIVLEATIQARNAAVIAAAPLALARTTTRARTEHPTTVVAPRPLEQTPDQVPLAAFSDQSPLAAFLDEPETPFYELEREESLVYEAVDAALTTAAPIVTPPAQPSLPPVETIASLETPQPPAVSDAIPAPPAAIVIPLAVETPSAERLAPPPLAVSVPEENLVPPLSSPPIAVRSAPSAEAAPNLPPPALVQPLPERTAAASETEIADRPLTLIRTIDRGRLDAVKSMFASAGVGMLAHFLLANLIAAAQSPDGSDPFGLARFIDDQTTILNRLWVAKRLRKPMDVRDSPATVETLEPLSRERLPPAGSLVVRIPATERAFVNAAAARETLTFLRARQVALILQPTAVVVGTEIVPVLALVEYAKRAQNLMTKYALRAATKTPDEALATVDPVLDGYARDVLAYLETIAR